MTDNSNNKDISNNNSQKNENNKDLIINENDINYFDELNGKNKKEEKQAIKNDFSDDSKNIIDNSDIIDSLWLPESPNEIKEVEKIEEKKDDLKIVDDNISKKIEAKEETTEEVKKTSKNIKKEEKESKTELIDNSDIIDSLNLPDTSNNNIQDININNINDLLNILIKKKYDSVVLEPGDSDVKLEFRTNGVILDTKYIKYPIYSSILLKAKSIWKLSLDITDQEQESTVEEDFWNKSLKITTKVVWSNFWEKLFLKATEIEKKIKAKEVNKVSAGQVLSFIWITAAIALIVWGSFLAFIVLNAQTVEDVRFFQWLWISLNDINNFISKVVTVVFTALMIIETIVLITFLFKFFLTKKELKKKKMQFGILSATLLVATLSTLWAWMMVDQKIRELPNWQEMSYWEIQLYDNNKLTNENFDKQWSLITDTSRIIWPIDIMFDLTYLAQNQQRRGIKIESYIWNFWWLNVESAIPTLIHTFNTSWTIKPTLTIKWKDMLWRETSEIIENIPVLNITHVINIEERTLSTWWKQVTFDASSIQELWTIEWYEISNINSPLMTWYRYITKPLFENTVFLMKIKNIDWDINRLFVVRWNNETDLSWKIEYNKSLTNDLEVTFRVANINNSIWSWFVEKFIWKIWSQEYTRIWDIDNQEKSSEIKHSFMSYWPQDISVEMINTAWERKKLNAEINLTKTLRISEWINIIADWVLINDIWYNSSLNEYMINDLWIPNKLVFDWRNIKTDSVLYILKDISWDFDSDWNIDYEGKKWEYSINAEWNYEITAKIQFENRRNTKDIEEIIQKIFIQAVKKEAIVDFEIISESEYVPATISFDASKSQVRDANIVRFKWDFWDWIVEDRDAIVPGHIYTEAWDYEIKLTVTTKDWRSYSNSKSLILKPAPQSVKIKSSLKRAPVWQWIDFVSGESEWQISSYLWDFWDWNISTQANPTHAFQSIWKYNVKLRLEFTNRNVLEDSIEIEVY